MLKYVLLIYLFVGPTLAGLALIPTLLAFNTTSNAWTLPAAAGAGALIGLVVSYLVARAITKPRSSKPAHA